MHDPESSHHELNEFEAQLAALAPQARLDRDRLMFAAGRNAGARPLRVANRLLAATSVALAALAAVVVALPRLSREPNVRDEPPPAAGATLAEAAGDDAPIEDVTRGSVAAIDGSTIFRLRRQFERGFDERLPERTERAPRVGPDEEVSPPSYSRALLKRYLETTPDRL